MVNINKLETAKGKEFNRIKARISFVGSSDYDYKKALIWKENYYDALSGYSEFEHYEDLMKILSRFSNPISLFNYAKETIPNLIDDYIKSISDQNLTQKQFNKILYDLNVPGITIKDIE